MASWWRQARRLAFGRGFSVLREHSSYHKVSSFSQPSFSEPVSAPEQRRRQLLLLGFSAKSREGLHFLGFCTRGPSSRAAEAALLLGFTGLSLLLNANLSYAEDQESGLRQQPEAKSNIHTVKWRIFTDKARDFCSQGSYENAEKFFYRALEEAKLGFGEQDPHVASCYNNLAELFRMKKEYEKAEPFYLEAVKRLRQSSGGVEDGSVGFALHNLGGFYLLQRKLEQARGCYEEALNIKGRALGLDHPEYANTMFHLGEVIRLQGHVNDGLALIRDSIRILEQIGLGNTTLAVKRLTRFSELLVFSGLLGEAEAVQRKVLQVLEFSKDFSSKDVAAALDILSATLQKQGKLDECVALLEQSISILKKNGSDQDIHMALLLLKLGGISFEHGRNAALQMDSLCARASYDKAEGLLCEAVEIAELHHREANAGKRKNSNHGNAVAALYYPILLARCLTILVDLRIHKLEILANSEESWKTCRDTERVLHCAISCLEEILVQQGEKPSSEVRKLYHECSQHLAGLNKRKINLQSQGHA